jgi:PAS domain S-box-containing protein
MKAFDKDIFYGQKLETIRQEITNTSLSDVSDDELLELFSKYAQQLFSILDKDLIKKNSPYFISELCDIFYTSFKEPLFIVDNALNICYKNIPDLKKFEDFKNTVYLKDILKGEELTRLRSKISERNHCQISVSSYVPNLNFNLVIIPFESHNNEEAYTLLIFRDSDPAPRIKYNFEIPDLYKKLLDTINGFYFVTDSSLSIILASESVKEKLGYSTIELIGKPIEVIIPKNFNLSFYKQLADVSLSKEYSINSKPSAIEITLLDDKKKNSYYEIAFSRYNNDITKPPFLLCICTDINIRRRKAIELEEDRDKAEQNDQLKSEFLSNMSHEIRTPLNGIIGFSAMLDREGITTEKKEKYMKIIRSSTRQLLTLVNDIIDFSKIEAGQLKIIFNKTDVKRLIDELYLTYSHEITRLNKDSIALLKFTDNSNKKVFLNTDDIRMQQVFINLLNNALKFTDNGEIEFGYTISEKDDTIRFFVRDTGKGIPQVQQDMIFNRFIQTTEGEKQKYNGTGLGLAISKGIVELMGGKLHVVSKINMGSEFYFTLPLNGIQES